MRLAELKKEGRRPGFFFQFYFVVAALSRVDPARSAYATVVDPIFGVAPAEGRPASTPGVEPMAVFQESAINIFSGSFRNNGRQDRQDRQVNLVVGYSI